MWHVWEAGEGYTGFGGGGMRERDNLEDVDVDGRIILKLILKNWDGYTWTVFISLRIGTVGGRLRM